jgi:hypothetical protein
MKLFEKSSHKQRGASIAAGPRNVNLDARWKLLTARASILGETVRLCYAGSDACLGPQALRALAALGVPIVRGIAAAPRVPKRKAQLQRTGWASCLSQSSERGQR